MSFVMCVLGHVMCVLGHVICVLGHVMLCCTSVPVFTMLDCNSYTCTCCCTVLFHSILNFVCCNSGNSNMWHNPSTECLLYCSL